MSIKPINGFAALGIIVVLIIVLMVATISCVSSKLGDGYFITDDDDNFIWVGEVYSNGGIQCAVAEAARMGIQLTLLWWVLSAVEVIN